MNHFFDGNFGEVFERQPLIKTKRCPKDVLKGLKKNHHLLKVGSFTDFPVVLVFPLQATATSTQSNQTDLPIPPKKSQAGPSALAMVLQRGMP